MWLRKDFDCGNGYNIYILKLVTTFFLKLQIQLINRSNQYGQSIWITNLVKLHFSTPFA